MTQKPTTTTTRAENSAGFPIPEGETMNLPAQTTNPGGNLVGTSNDRGIHHAGQTSNWTPAQRDELRALMNAGDASDGDLAMLSTVSDRTGLDPFLKQLYLIGRKTKTGGYNGEPERWETKWTVQTGIDGFRQVTHRYAAKQGVPATIGRAIFYDAEGTQHPIWLKAWGFPAAAEVTVTVGGSEATGIATWDEYVQLTKKGQPNSMWVKFGPTMLAKCAEAQAHRRVCPLGAGMYEPAEMRQPVRAEATRVDAQQGGALGALEAARQRVHARRQPEPEPEPAQDADVVTDDDPQLLAAVVDEYLSEIPKAQSQDEVTKIMNAAKEDGLPQEQFDTVRQAAKARWEELNNA